MKADIGKNIDGDYIINGRLYTERDDGNYHLIPISMDEARQRPENIKSSYTKDEIIMMVNSIVKEPESIDVLEAMGFLSGELSLHIKNDTCYVIDSYRLGDKNYDYGIYSSFPKDNLLKGEFSPEDIPDMFFDDTFNFLLDDEPMDNVDDDIKNVLSESTYSEWADILLKNGYVNEADYLSSLCNWIKTGKVKQETEESLEKYEVQGWQATVIDSIENYEKENSKNDYTER